MTLDIPTLSHNVAQLDRDGEALNKQITDLTAQIAQAQQQLVLLHGAREYNGLAVKRAHEVLATAQAEAQAAKAAATTVVPTT